MVLSVGNAVIQTFVPVKLSTPGVAQNAKVMNLLLQALFFTIANSLSARLFTLLIMFVKVMKTCQHMSLQGGYRSGR
jgi:hypothetical protein